MSEYLMHHGVKGQKWGVRRYQYADGTLIPAGRKRYSDLMSKHDVERANARRAVDVASNRSRMKASIKRSMSMTVKAAATTAAIGAGAYAVNRYLTNHDVTVNGRPLRVGAQTLSSVADMARKARNFTGYFY